MIPLTLFLTAAALDRAAPIFTIEEVRVNRRYAGSFGSRLITEMVLTTGPEKFKVTIRDTRHSRFQKAEAGFIPGKKVRIRGGLSADWTSLRPDQIEHF